MHQTIKNDCTWLLVALTAGLFAVATTVGCGSKKPKDKSADDMDAGAEDISTDEEAIDDSTTGTGTGTGTGTTPTVPVKGPAVYPDAPANNHANRQTRPYLLSVRKAQVIPMKATGECWDPCDDRTATALGTAMTGIGMLPGNNATGFDIAAKALQTGIGAVGGQEALPDVYVHIRCGHDQAHATQKTAAMNRIVATWTSENKTLQLDERDECVISVWDHDDDGDEEIGRTTVRLVQLANSGGGTARIFGRDVGFGQVFHLELGLAPQGSGGGGTGTGGGAATPAPTPGAGNYSVTVVRAEVKHVKADGQPWDVAVPMLGKTEPDVFVNAWINGYKSPSPFLTTAIKNDNFNPVWDESGTGQLGPNDHIVFMVWDKDAVTDDLIGECKTGPMKSQSMGEVVLRNCGQVVSLTVRISKN